MKSVFHIVSNKEWGGGEQYVYDLSLRQQAEGISVTVFEIMTDIPNPHIAVIIPVRMNSA